MTTIRQRSNGHIQRQREPLPMPAPRTGTGPALTPAPIAPEPRPDQRDDGQAEVQTAQKKQFSKALEKQAAPETDHRLSDSPAMARFKKSAKSDASTAAVAASGAPFEQGRTIPPPRALYHWTIYQSLERSAQRQPADGSLPLKKIKPDFTVAKQFPQLADRAALYAWSNPVTGIGASPTEIYSAPMGYIGIGALLKLEIDPNAKAVEIVTDSSDKNPHPDVKLDDAQLALHKVMYKGKLVMQEWLVLDPKAVKSFTGNPADLRDELEAELKHMANPRFRYKAEDLHYQSDGSLFEKGKAYDAVPKIIKKFLASSDEQIPDFFDHGQADKK